MQRNIHAQILVIEAVLELLHQLHFGFGGGRRTGIPMIAGHIQIPAGHAPFIVEIAIQIGANALARDIAEAIGTAIFAPETFL